MWHDLLVAIALVLVLEGLLPFLNPDAMRRALMKLVSLNDNTLRFAGLTSMILGCLLLYALR
jgi:uncharacterized protein YjeT (DUF2065 family)